MCVAVLPAYQLAAASCVSRFRLATTLEEGELATAFLQQIQHPADRLVSGFATHRLQRIKLHRDVQDAAGNLLSVAGLGHLGAAQIVRQNEPHATVVPLRDSLADPE